MIDGYNYEMIISMATKQRYSSTMLQYVIGVTTNISKTPEYITETIRDFILDTQALQVKYIYAMDK